MGIGWASRYPHAKTCLQIRHSITCHTRPGRVTGRRSGSALGFRRADCPACRPAVDRPGGCSRPGGQPAQRHRTRLARVLPDDRGRAPRFHPGDDPRRPRGLPAPLLDAAGPGPRPLPRTRPSTCTWRGCGSPIRTSPRTAVTAGTTGRASSCCSECPSRCCPSRRPKKHPKACSGSSPPNRRTDSKTPSRPSTCATRRANSGSRTGPRLTKTSRKCGGGSSRGPRSVSSATRRANWSSRTSPRGDPSAPGRSSRKWAARLTPTAGSFAFRVTPAYFRVDDRATYVALLFETAGSGAHSRDRRSGGGFRFRQDGIGRRGRPRSRDLPPRDRAHGDPGRRGADALRSLPDPAAGPPPVAARGGGRAVRRLRDDAGGNRDPGLSRDRPRLLLRGPLRRHHDAGVHRHRAGARLPVRPHPLRTPLHR